MNFIHSIDLIDLSLSIRLIDISFNSIPSIHKFWRWLIEFRVVIQYKIQIVISFLFEMTPPGSAPSTSPPTAPPYTLPYIHCHIYIAIIESVFLSLILTHRRFPLYSKLVLHQVACSNYTTYCIYHHPLHYRQHIIESAVY